MRDCKSQKLPPVSPAVAEAATYLLVGAAVSLPKCAKCKVSRCEARPREAPLCLKSLASGGNVLSRLDKLPHSIRLSFSNRTTGAHVVDVLYTISAFLLGCIEPSISLMQK